MKSSIKIDFIDRGTGKGIEPVIRVDIIDSDDPRDTLVSYLFESLSGQTFLQISYTNHKHLVTQSGYPDMTKTALIFKPEINTDEMNSVVYHFFSKWVAEQKYTLFSGGINGLYMKEGEDKSRPEADLFKEFISIHANHHD